MYRMLVVAPLTALLLTACVVAPADRGGGLVVAPALPMVVELGVEPYYFQGGFYYYYHNNGWSYSSAKSGPWRDLPRERYPRETRFRDQGGGRDYRDHGGGQDHRDHGGGQDRGPDHGDH
ncbi:MAG: hypothetical protein WBX11_08300 [Thiobacillaceae bacterium]